MFVSPAVTAKPVGAAVLHEINSLNELVLIHQKIQSGLVIVEQAGSRNVGRRIEVQQLLTNRVKLALGNDVPRDRGTAERLVDHDSLRQEFGEIPVAHGGRRDTENARVGLPLTKPFKIRHEKQAPLAIENLGNPYRPT